MANPIVELKIEWYEVSASCEPCHGCNDVIYGKQYQLFIEPGGATETRLCESCYNALEG
jgi:hypothetical protein